MGSPGDPETPVPQVGRGPRPCPCGQEGQEAFLAHPSQAMARGSAPLSTLPCPHPRGSSSCPQPSWGQLPAPPEAVLHNLLPSPPKEPAEILLSPVLLHLGCKNRKNPTVLAGTSVASESIFPASAGKEKYKFKPPAEHREARRVRTGMHSPRRSTEPWNS